MFAQNQAILPKIGIVLGVVLTCWLLIGVVAAQTQPKSTPTAIGATPVRQASATVRGSTTPVAAPRTPTASTFTPPVRLDQPGPAARRPVAFSAETALSAFTADEARAYRALHPHPEPLP